MRLLLLMAILLAGCEYPDLPDLRAIPSETPVVNIPYPMREQNWGSGSCVHATTISLLRWQGQQDLANWWRSNHGGGEWDTSFAAKLDMANVRYAYTSRRGDVQFLEWACRTRRGCGVTVQGGRHMVALVHLDHEKAGLLDNNQIHRIIWVSRKTFIAEWLNSNSWAITPVYVPAAPMPPKQRGKT